VGELSNLKTGGKWLDENLGWAEFFDCLIWNGNVIDIRYAYG
jgi:hypothetical protein